jgi:hypothetical protein
MVAETLGLTLTEVDELPMTELSIWAHWFAFKAQQQRKVQREARSKSRGRARRGR